MANTSAEGYEIAGVTIDQRFSLIAMSPAQRRQRLRELATWVSWLVNCFDAGNHIPICWYRHDGAIERLHALFVEWVRTYGCQLFGQPSLGPLRWIEALDRHLSRLGFRSDCLMGRHVAESRPGWRLDADFDTWLTAPPHLRSDNVPEDDVSTPGQPIPINDPVLHQLLESGRAERYLDNTLIHADNRWWLGDGHEYVLLTDETTIAYLEQQVSRLRRAAESEARLHRGAREP